MTGPGEKPYPEYIEYMTPTPSAPPPGSVFATAVEAWFTFIVCQTLLPGRDAIITSQYVARFQSAAKR